MFFNLNNISVLRQTCTDGNVFSVIISLSLLHYFGLLPDLYRQYSRIVTTANVNPMWNAASLLWYNLSRFEWFSAQLHAKIFKSIPNTLNLLNNCGIPRLWKKQPSKLIYRILKLLSLKDKTLWNRYFIKMYLEEINSTHLVLNSVGKIVRMLYNGLELFYKF